MKKRGIKLRNVLFCIITLIILTQIVSATYCKETINKHSSSGHGLGCDIYDSTVRETVDSCTPQASARSNECTTINCYVDQIAENNLCTRSQGCPIDISTISGTSCMCSRTPEQKTAGGFCCGEPKTFYPTKVETCYLDVNPELAYVPEFNTTTLLTTLIFCSLIIGLILFRKN